MMAVSAFSIQAAVVCGLSGSRASPEMMRWRRVPVCPVGYPAVMVVRLRRMMSAVMAAMRRVCDSGRRVRAMTWSRSVLAEPLLLGLLLSLEFDLRQFGLGLLLAAASLEAHDGEETAYSGESEGGDDENASVMM